MKQRKSNVRFFELEENIFKELLDRLLLTKCSKLQDLVTPFDSFESMPSTTAAYNPIPEIDIVDLTSKQTSEAASVEDNDNASSVLTSTPKRTSTIPIENLSAKLPEHQHVFPA